MPAVAAPATVLVTGATGFIAAHIVQTYLAAGFTVIGTVRRALGGEYLKRTVKFPERFSYIVVEDIQSSGALDGVVPHVDVIVHTASPMVHPEGEYDPQMVIRLAVDGTHNVLASAALASSKVQRVVITSSIASLVQPHEMPYEYTDADWNEFAVETVGNVGSKAPQRLKYYASKVLAERAAVDFVELKKPKFDVVRILPGIVFGPMINDIKSANELSETSSMGILWQHFVKPEQHAEPTRLEGPYVDVRDVARTHLEATTRPELGGERIISASVQCLSCQDFYDAYYAIPIAQRPVLPFKIPIGQPGAGDKAREEFPTFSNVGQKKLGWELRSFVDTLRDALQSLTERDST